MDDIFKSLYTIGYLEVEKEKGKKIGIWIYLLFHGSLLHLSCDHKTFVRRLKENTRKDKK